MQLGPVNGVVESRRSRSFGIQFALPFRGPERLRARLSIGDILLAPTELQRENRFRSGKYWLPTGDSENDARNLAK